MYVCQSVSWLTFLLKLDKYRDISSSGWDIFLKFFGGIPEMFLQFFKILTNFMYVCQSVSWLKYLLKLGQYRDISCSGWDFFQIFCRYFWDIGTLATKDSEFHVCLSVFLFADFLTKIRQRDIYGSGNFWRHSWDVGALVPNNSDFFACLSVW